MTELEPIIFPGQPYPLGATPDEQGTNFAIFSAHATQVELCLFDQYGENEIHRINLTQVKDDIWHIYIQGVRPGSLYGYRVNGDYAPEQGHRFNPNKLLLDPYAKQLKGDFIWSDTHYAFDYQSPEKDLMMDCRNNANYLPKCVVSKQLVPLESCQSPTVSQTERIIYELHVKGFTQNNPDVAIKYQGTFKGLAQQGVIHYLKKLGITSVELMPVNAFFDEPFLLKKNLKNFWGYNSIAFFAPQPQYCYEENLEEFQHLVKTFHQANIEVILDVVFNHTAEGDHLGPTYSFKGIDNRSYYCLDKTNPRYYDNRSGCGNTLNIQHPRVLQLVMDCLRYWVSVMQVDGFRFDLAAILGRETRLGQTDFYQKNTFFSTLQQDPILANIKLIAEPWDIGNNSYQLGQFPSNWLEWNDQYRDIVRSFWRGDQGILPQFAKRIHGSHDLFQNKGERSHLSVNYIAAHDGFTLEDLVSYQTPRNLANGEKNKDGHQQNFSTNYGVEGKTNQIEILQLRAKQKRNLLATLMLSKGTPMLLAGDEFNNSQNGNNNAYCQDNPTGWLDWQNRHKTSTDEIKSFIEQLIVLRKTQPLLNRDSYPHGQNYSAKTQLADISWLHPDGKAMSQNNWYEPELKCFAMLLAEVNDGIHQSDALLVIFNANQYEYIFNFPKLNGIWKILLYTDVSTPTINLSEKETFAHILVAAQSCVILSYQQHEISPKQSLKSDIAPFTRENNL